MKKSIMRLSVSLIVVAGPVLVAMSVLVSAARRAEQVGSRPNIVGSDFDATENERQRAAVVRQSLLDCLAEIDRLNRAVAAAESDPSHPTAKTAVDGWRLEVVACRDRYRSIFLRADKRLLPFIDMPADPPI